MNGENTFHLFLYKSMVFDQHDNFKNVSRMIRGNAIRERFQTA